MSNFSSAQIAATVVAQTSSSKSSKDANTPIWERSVEELDAYVREGTLLKLKFPTKNEKTQELLKPPLFQKIWKTLEAALASVYLEEIPEPEAASETNGDEDGADSPPKPSRKRRKRVKQKLVDPYNLWVHVKRLQDDETEEGERDDSDVDVPLTPGGKLSVLSVGGILNGMAGVQGGVTKRVTPSEDSIASVKATPSSELPLVDYLGLAHAWHTAIQKQVHLDILSTTPRRIKDMLCADLTDTEFASIRKRIYDTVVMGKGLHVNDPSNDADKELAVGPSATAHDIEKFKKCQNCGNNDQASFVLDRRNGDVICSNCGTVVSESIMHEGSQFRKFEGEVDRNHHGDAPNPLYSNAHNLSTSLSGVAQTSGAGIGGWKSGGGGRNLETILRNAHAYVSFLRIQLAPQSYYQIFSAPRS